MEDVSRQPTRSRSRDPPARPGKRDRSRRSGARRMPVDASAQRRPPSTPRARAVRPRAVRAGVRAPDACDATGIAARMSSSGRSDPRALRPPSGCSRSCRRRGRSWLQHGWRGGDQQESRHTMLRCELGQADPEALASRVCASSAASSPSPASRRQQRDQQALHGIEARRADPIFERERRHTGFPTAGQPRSRGDCNRSRRLAALSEDSNASEELADALEPNPP